MGSDFTSFPDGCHGPVPLRGLFRGRTLRKGSRTINQSPLSAPAGSPASAAGRHLLRLSHNPATETLYADITQRLAA